MIKVSGDGYFSNIAETRSLNQYMQSYSHTELKDFFEAYIAERYNATYERAEGWPSTGHFIFENERDAIMFILRFG